MAELNTYEDSVAIAKKFELVKNDYYKQLYPSMWHSVPCPYKYKYFQMQGVDRVIFNNAEPLLIKVEEKIRERVIGRDIGTGDPDILLEYISNDTANPPTPGWINRDLQCDKVLYVFLEDGIAYFIDWKELKHCWNENKAIWFQTCQKIASHNPGHDSLNLVVPYSLVKEYCNITTINVQNYVPNHLESVYDRHKRGLL